MGRTSSTLLALVGALAWRSVAFGQGGAEEAAAADGAATGALTAAEEKQLARLERNRGATARFFATASGGTGFRFNNPYRLSSQVGEDATSLSTIDPYFDVSANFVFGPVGLPQHGVSLHVGAPVVGVFQPFITPSYILAYRGDLPVLLYGRVGTPMLLSPDFNLGAELAGSASYFVTPGIGFTGEVMLDLFYGAATLETQASTVPVLALSWGVIVDVEFLQ